MRFLILLLVALIFTGCITDSGDDNDSATPKVNNSIVGAWQSIGGEGYESYVFRSDGTYSVYSNKTSYQYTYSDRDGTYSISNNMLTLYYIHGTNSITDTCVFLIENNRLSIKRTYDSYYLTYDYLRISD